MGASKNQIRFILDGELVEIEDRTMKITPLSSEAVDVRDKDGHSVPLPIVIHAAEPEGTTCGKKNRSSRSTGGSTHFLRSSGAALL